jgi:hypothetical protein
LAIIWVAAMIDVKGVRRVALALAILGVALAILGTLPGEYVAGYDGGEDVIAAGGWPLDGWIAFVVAGAGVMALRPRAWLAWVLMIGTVPATIALWAWWFDASVTLLPSRTTTAGTVVPIGHLVMLVLVLAGYPIAMMKRLTGAMQ